MARLTVMVISSGRGRYGGWRRRRLSRRALLRASARAGVGATGLALVGCGEDDSTEEEPLEPLQQQEQAAAQSEQADQAEVAQEDTEQEQAERVPPADPVRGGILRAWLPIERHDRWDPHRSRYRITQAFHSVMYNRLLRPVSVSSGELEPDLCGLPELPDESTYVFTVSDGAVYWDQAPTDGRAFTAEDVRWNIERQQEAVDAEGAPDPYFFRGAAYQRTASIEVTGDDTVQLTTDGPDAAYLGSVHAGPYAWMTSPEAANEWGDEWRDNAFNVNLNSGTGPYVPIGYDGREFILGRSENWWGGESAWPDGIVFAGGAEGTIVSTYILGQLDFIDFPLPSEVVQAVRDERPDDPTYDLALPAPVQLLTPLGDRPDSPFGDPRMVRALALAVDRGKLLERLYAGDGQMSGPVPPQFEGWALAPEQLSSFAGYRGDRDADLVEIQQLISAAGGVGGFGPVTLAVADLFEGLFAGSGEAARTMIAEATGLEIELEYLPLPDSLGRLASGDRFLFLTWGETATTADPTDAWRSTLHSDGERNWGGVSDPELDRLIDEMGITFDLDARRGLAHEVQERLLGGDTTQWMVNLVNGTQLGVAQPYLRLDPHAREYAWSWARLPGSWLDTEHELYDAGRALPETEATDQPSQE